MAQAMATVLDLSQLSCRSVSKGASLRSASLQHAALPLALHAPFVTHSTPSLQSRRPLLRSSLIGTSLKRSIVDTKKTNASKQVSASQEQSEVADVEKEMDGFYEKLSGTDKIILSLAAAVTPLLLAEDAQAAEILKGRTASLTHPVIMFLLLATTLWTGYLGYQWRRIRLIQDEINDLKKQLPAKGEDGKIPPSPVDAKISALTETRKDLLKGGYRDRHFNTSSILLGGGTTFAIAGAYNTYLRTGKLFPGPHLYAGAGIVILWALAAALVPAMQKGNDVARSAHIGLNAVNVGLFLWQVPTGLEIVWKVLEFTTFP